MSIQHTITEVREHRYEFSLSPQQVQDAIVHACVKAAGLTLPLGVNVEIIGDAVFAPAGIRFTVPVEVEKTADQILAGIEGLTDAVAAPAAPQSAPVDAIAATALPETPSGAPARPTAPVRALPKMTRPAKWLDLTITERGIVLHLEALPDTFAPTDDLEIVEGLTGGKKATFIASEMGMGVEEIVARWKSMWCSGVLESSRTPTIAGQQRLLTALRYRVETEG